MSSKQFIKTTDVSTKNTLVKEGFPLIDASNGVYTFLNNTSKKVQFDKSKISYSNVLACTAP